MSILQKWLQFLLAKHLIVNTKIKLLTLKEKSEDILFGKNKTSHLLVYYIVVALTFGFSNSMDIFCQVTMKERKWEPFLIVTSST